MTSDMFGRFEESYQKYKRPDGYNFMKESKSVGVPVALDSSTYRHAFSESRDESGGPSKRAKTLSGQPAEAFEYRLARSVRRLGESLVTMMRNRITQNSSSLVLSSLAELKCYRNDLDVIHLLINTCNASR